MYPEKLKVIAQQVQLQQQQEQVRLLHQEKLEREQQIRTQVSRLPALLWLWPTRGDSPAAPQPLRGGTARRGGSGMCLAPPEVAWAGQ